MVSPFSHPWWESFTSLGPKPRCKDEWLIVEISRKVREEPDWRVKFKNPTESIHWIASLKKVYGEKTKHINEVIEYVWAELDWYDAIESALSPSGFKFGCDDKILLSDEAVDNGVKARLSEEVKNYEELLGTKSGDKVVDLIDPSLYPLQYGITPVYTDFERFDVEIIEYSEDIPKVKKWVAKYGTSKKYQLLPSVLRFNEENKKFEFRSYINNLHPINQAKLYFAFSEIFNSILPGLNLSLSRYASTPYIRVEIPPFENAYEEEFQEKYDAFVNELEPWDDVKFREFHATKVNYLKTFVPEFNGGPIQDRNIDLAKDFGEVKVIVKLTDVQLTPEYPTYDGRPWQSEGKINEDIVATVLYYFDAENITEPKLDFRTAFDDPKYEQGDSFYPKEIYGLEAGDSMTKEIGDVVVKEGRVLIFPNCYQSRVDPFQLKDNTKKGHCKILSFFIVDPYNELVVPTSHVPPQQKEWWDDPELSKTKITSELKEKILALTGGSDWPLSIAQATGIRDLLLDERSQEEDRFDENPAFTRKFDFHDFDT
ncbi:uncharacterized protein RJT20DRAFT_43091 [Scheffersomyces xylosifermentans]|uniref:uncharacterized protein n=1 Tax=Scheffersomyces xylosifermentans TaxID=1304137 RepID=UPI00315CCF39